ncbi:expressed unknown protein [Seminavis robusta]|uniref:DUF6824 domain-containing protein n=1 Tax=Seminavis robusta TaxID=568900 RepID=A0A9N8E678_9STRA|nr:expressed unknown protein [Seminavis robusta]|eukprot:Sro705_g190270.1 n/a (292) ;mRNA; f:8246-9207
MSIQPQQLSDIEYPTLQDCLFGRGGHTSCHPGNVKYRTMIQGYREIYHHADKEHKIEIVKEIIYRWRAQEPPGRFLVLSQPNGRTGRTWYDVGDREAMKKVIGTLRIRKPTCRKANKTQAVVDGNTPTNLLGRFLLASQTEYQEQQRRQQNEQHQPWDALSPDASDGSVGCSVVTAAATDKSTESAVPHYSDDASTSPLLSAPFAGSDHYDGPSLQELSSFFLASCTASVIDQSDSDCWDEDAILPLANKMNTMIEIPLAVELTQVVFQEDDEQGQSTAIAQDLKGLYAIC